MRILFTGAAPWANSGYGKPMRYLLPRMVQAGHPCALATFYGYQGTTTTTQIGGQPVRIFGIARERWFNDIIEYHAVAFGADMVISLQDVWILQEWGKKGFTWLPWMPVDTWPVTAPVLDAIEGCYAPLSYSQWGRDRLVDAGWENARYMPFGVDLEIHQPRPKQEARVRASLADADGVPYQGFIAGMVAANSSYPSRKSFPEVLMAWKKWLDGGGEGLLYIHTTVTPKQKLGLDFERLLEVIGLPWSTTNDPDPERRARATVIFPGQHRMWCHAYDDKALADLYNSFDVLLSPSMSEGFGIPILEAQACGVPVVTLNCTSMPELTFAGMCLEPVQLYWYDQGGWRGVVGVDDLAGAIEWAHQMSRGTKARQYHAEKGRANAMRFDWDTLMVDRWLPLLAEVAGA